MKSKIPKAGSLSPQFHPTCPLVTAIEYGKRVGRKLSLWVCRRKSYQYCQELGYINLTDQDLIPVDRVKNFPDNKLLFLVAGFAGQPESALNKMVMGKHRVKIKKGDKVIFSSPDYIPGTTSAIFEMIDNLAKLGADVVYGEKQELHVSGHGYQKEHALLIRLVNPKFLLPIGGNFRHIRSYHSMAKNLGYNDDQLITPEYDSAVTFYKDGSYDTKYHISLRKVLIDGLGIGDVGTTVLRDRKTLAEDGMFSVVVLVNKETGQLFKEPVVLSRGFVFVKENTDLINFLREETSLNSKKSPVLRPILITSEKISNHIWNRLSSKKPAANPWCYHWSSRYKNSP
jgi:ribonuclease J